MTLDEMSVLSRRDLLRTSLALGTSALAAAPTLTVASSIAKGDLDSVNRYRKLRYRTDSGLVFWWLQGVKYGQVGTTLTPLYTSLIGTIQRITPTDDGGFDMTMLEMVIKLDLDGNEPLEEWKNPYTGEVLPVTFDPVGPTTVRYSGDNSRVLPKELGGARIEAQSQTHPAVIVGDDLFMSEVVSARVFRPGREQPFEVHDMSNYHGSLSELSNPEVTMASATVSFAEVTGWQRWMNMGSRPGNLTSRTVGAKVNSFQQMPEKWRRLLAQKAPEIAADPAASLDRPAAEFIR